MWKAAVFDLDGVLLDTEPLQYKAWAEVLKPLGIGFTEKEYEDYIGNNANCVAERMTAKHGIKDKARFLQERISVIERFVSEGELKLMPHAMDAIEFFRKHNFKIAIATGSLRKELDIKLSRTGLGRMFCVAVSESEVSRGKPCPDVYLRAAELLGVNPKDCIAFEDTPSGVQAAKAAGMACFAVPNKYVKGRDFSRADGAFNSLQEAVAHVKSVMN